MSKPNLVQELGSAYMSERFYGSMFYDEEKRPCYIDNNVAWPRDKIAAVALTRADPDKPEAAPVALPYPFFKDMSVFWTPPLGWRMAGEGRYLAYLRRNNRSYHRGIASHILTRWLSPASEILMDSDNLNYGQYDSLNATLALVMNPQYIPLRQGSEAMRKGDLFSFAASPTVAVIPGLNDTQSIYFNTNKVGEISAKGVISCASPAIEDIIKEHE